MSGRIASHRKAQCACGSAVEEDHDIDRNEEGESHSHCKERNSAAQPLNVQVISMELGLARLDCSGLLEFRAESKYGAS